MVRGVDPFEAALAYHILREFYTTEDLMTSLYQNDIIGLNPRICQQILLTYILINTPDHSSDDLVLISQFSHPLPSNFRNEIGDIAVHPREVIISSYIRDIPYSVYIFEEAREKRANQVLTALDKTRI